MNFRDDLNRQRRFTKRILESTPAGSPKYERARHALRELERHIEAYTGPGPGEPQDRPKPQ